MARRLSTLLVTTEQGPIMETLGVAAGALQGGVSAILVRRPRAPAREVFEIARQLRPATRHLGCVLLVSDRVDVALAVDADGVHLGERSLPPAAARRILRPGMLLGISVHNLDEAGEAEAAGADYLLLGPLFATATHPDREPLGLLDYREAVLRARIPVLGIGGIDTRNVKEVAAAGGPGAAAIRAYYDAVDVAETARSFRAAFGSR